MAVDRGRHRRGAGAADRGVVVRVARRGGPRSKRASATASTCRPTRGHRLAGVAGDGIGLRLRSRQPRGRTTSTTVSHENWDGGPAAAGLDRGAYHFFTLCTPASRPGLELPGHRSDRDAVALPPARRSRAGRQLPASDPTRRRSSESSRRFLIVGRGGVGSPRSCSTSAVTSRVAYHVQAPPRLGPPLAAEASSGRRTRSTWTDLAGPGRSPRSTASARRCRPRCHATVPGRPPCSDTSARVRHRDAPSPTRPSATY